MTPQPEKSYLCPLKREQQYNWEDCAAVQADFFCLKMKQQGFFSTCLKAWEP